LPAKSDNADSLKNCRVCFAGKPRSNTSPTRTPSSRSAGPTPTRFARTCGSELAREERWRGLFEKPRRKKSPRQGSWAQRRPL